MSSTTPTTYTSAATQTMPLTSQLATSVSAASSHLAKSPETGPSPTFALVLLPHHAAKSQEGSLDGVFSLMTKFAALLIGASVERQLILSATTDIFTAHLFIAILWFVFGGHRKLFADDPVQPFLPLDGSRRVSSNVESWLGKLRSLSNAITAVAISPGLRVEVARVDSAHENQKCDSIDAHDAEPVSLEPSGIADIVSVIGDHHDVLARKDSIAIEKVYDADQALLDLSEPVKLDQLEFDAPMDEATLIQDHCVMQPGLSLTTTELLVLTRDEPQLSALLKEHEYPIFRLGGIYDKAVRAAIRHNCMYPIIAEHVSEVCSKYSGWPTEPGRPVADDEQDIKFLYDAVCKYVPAYVIKALELQSLEYRSRYRCGITGTNFCRETLVLLWQTINSPGANIESLTNVMAVDEARVKRFRQECPPYERELHGPDSPYRPYLSDWEEYGINFGSGEYHPYFIYEEEPYALFQRLRDDPARKEIRSFQSPALNWLENMDFSQQLDPNAYDDCECMAKAADFIWEYRNESEHGYDSSSHIDFLYFPSAFNAPDVDESCQLCSRVAYPPKHSRLQYPPGLV
jgi:hypothetical protein